MGRSRGLDALLKSYRTHDTLTWGLGPAGRVGCQSTITAARTLASSYWFVLLVPPLGHLERGPVRASAPPGRVRSEEFPPPVRPRRAPGWHRRPSRSTRTSGEAGGWAGGARLWSCHQGPLRASQHTSPAGPSSMWHGRQIPGLQPVRGQGTAIHPECDVPAATPLALEEERTQEGLPLASLLALKMGQGNRKGFGTKVQPA